MFLQGSICGEGGIRTHGTQMCTTVFETAFKEVKSIKTYILLKLFDYLERISICKDYMDVTMEKIRAIVLEDDELIRLTIESVLKNRGYEVHSYSEPVFCPVYLDYKCICNLELPCTDIIITDLSMPHMNGLDFIEHQIQNGCKVDNIAVMSGYWTDQTLEKAIKIGCQIFEKPFDLNDLHHWLDGIEKRIKIEEKTYS